MNPTIPIPNHPNHPANHRNPDFPHSTPEALSSAASSDTNSHPRRPAPHALNLPGASYLQRIFIAITILCPVLLATQLHAQTELLPAGSDWQWLNLIDATTGNQIDPGTLDPDFHTTWQTSASYDGPTFSGPDPALLGYGGINAGPLATDIGTPTSGTRFTTYLRTTFTPEGLVAGLRFEGLIDDGAIFYVNGQEVARINMDPTAADSYGLLAAGNGDESNIVSVDVAERLNLAAGVPVEIGVSLHNQSAGSSDAGFDLRVLSTPGPPVEIEAELLYSVSGEVGRFFGNSGVHAMGDVNQDGFGDFAVTETGTTFNSGAVSFFSGLDGSFIYSTSSVSFWRGGGAKRLAPAGDLNGDGIPELLTLNSGHDSPASLTVFEGRTVFRRHNQSYPDTLGWNPQLLFDPFDFDGDGVDDYGFSVRAKSPDRIEIYLFSGQTGSPLRFNITSSDPETGVYSLVAIGHDLDGDENWDVIIEATVDGEHCFHALKGPFSEEAIDIDSVQPDRLVWSKSLPVDYYDHTIVGDVTNDGVVDFVGSVIDSGRRRVALVSGADGELVWNSLVGSGRLAPEGAVVIGDVNRDGYPDLVIPPFLLLAEVFTRIWLVSGADGRDLAHATAPNPDDGFGSWLAPIGDLNGDRISEVAVVAQRRTVNEEQPGRVHVFSFKLHREPTVEELAGFRLLKQGGQLLLNWNTGLSGATLEKSSDLANWETVNDVAIDGFYVVPNRVGQKAYYRLRFQR